MSDRGEREVSVVICVYNMEKYLDFCLQGVEAQTFRPKEVIIVDDGSSDASRTIIQDWGARLPIRCHFNDQNKGVGESRRAALSMVETEYVALLDADDFWLPEHLEALLRLAEPDRVVSPRAAVWISNSGLSLETTYARPVPAPARQLRELTKNNFVFSGSLFPLALITVVGGYPPVRVAEDYLLWLLAVSKGFKIVRPNRVTVLYRRHDASLSVISSSFFEQVGQALETNIGRFDGPAHRGVLRAIKVFRFRQYLASHDERESGFFGSFWNHLIPVILRGPMRLKVSALLRVVYVNWNRPTRRRDTPVDEREDILRN